MSPSSITGLQNQLLQHFPKMPTLSRKCISQYLGEENVIWALQGIELGVDNINLEGEDYKPTFPSPKVNSFFFTISKDSQFHLTSSVNPGVSQPTKKKKKNHNTTIKSIIHPPGWKILQKTKTV